MMHAFRKVGSNYELYTTTECYLIHELNYNTPVGAGYFGTVVKATQKSSKKEVAIKIIGKDLDPSIILRENQIMEKLRNEKKNINNVIYSIDFADVGDKLYIVMPFCKQGTLTQLIKSCTFSELETIDLFRQLCFGIRCLHQYNILHRDLKSDNVLVDKENGKYKLYISDVGISREFHTQMEMSDSIKTVVGTPLTRAPEVDSGKYGSNSDIYSLGCILFKMLTKEEPFHGKNLKEVTMNKNRSYIEIKRLISKFTLELLMKCLQINPAKRINDQDLFQLLKVNDLYTCYKFNPDLSPEKLKQGDVQYIYLNIADMDETQRINSQITPGEKINSIISEVKTGFILNEEHILLIPKLEDPCQCGLDFISLLNSADSFCSAMSGAQEKATLIASMPTLKLMYTSGEIGTTRLIGRILTMLLNHTDNYDSSNRIQLRGINLYYLIPIAYFIHQCKTESNTKTILEYAKDFSIWAMGIIFNYKIEYDKGQVYLDMLSSK